LFRAIVSTSYIGDFRMIVGENPNKIDNIVQAQLPHLQAMYGKWMADMSTVLLHKLW
jgi:hypothetical protein